MINLENSLYKVSSQIKYSLIWYLCLIRLSNILRFQSLVHLLNRIYNPIYKKLMY